MPPSVRRVFALKKFAEFEEGRSVIDARRRATHVFAVLLAAALAVGVCACTPPPALTKVELEAKTLPKTKHPKLSQKQMQDCRICHREAPAIRK